MQLCCMGIVISTDCSIKITRNMKNLLPVFLLFFYASLIAQPQSATLLGHWADETIEPAFFNNPYHDVWGAVVNDTEVGIITSTKGFHFFRLDDISGGLEPVAFAPATVQGQTIGHRDIKTYQHYLYAVADEGASALQVFDMSGLPESVEEVYSSDEFVTTAHNMFIDEDNARLYLVGGAGFSLRILSLENPEQPELLASFPNAETDIPYIHDLYVRDNIAYLHAGLNGFIVGDFTDPENPQLLGIMDSYIEQGYNHSGWLSEDGNYYFLADETHGRAIKVVDMRDLSNMKVVATMNANSFPGQIPHNVILQDGLLYTSYYYDGLQVYDVSNPLFPRRIAAYDTYDGPDVEFFAGAWGVFVLPSGRVLISDMNNGLYFFEAVAVPANTDITPNFATREFCQEETDSFIAQVGPGFIGNTVTLSAENTGDALQVQLSASEVAPGDVIEITVTGLAAGVADVVISATDGITEAESRIPVRVKGFPEPVELRAPVNGRENVDLSPFFFWSNPSGTTSFPKVLQVSTSLEAFEDNLVYDEPVSGVSIWLDIELEEGTVHYWRIGHSNECGLTYAEPFTFTTTGSITGLNEIGGNAFGLFPNPASSFLRLSFGQPRDGLLQLDWFALNGQLLRTDRVETATQTIELPLSALPEGVYVLRMSTDKESVIRRVLIQR